MGVYRWRRNLPLLSVLAEKQRQPTQCYNKGVGGHCDTVVL